jgi:hypothetical protein
VKQILPKDRSIAAELEQASIGFMILFEDYFPMIKFGL